MKRRLLAVALFLLAGSGLAQTLAPAPAAPSTALRARPADPEAWWNNAAFYEIFVRSFQDTNGDGIGDLNGVKAHLDDLKTLGVNALWLMPIYPSPSYHGYDVTDYENVNPDYGTLNDMDALLAAAHARGLKVILDWVPNHSSSAHPWFVAAKNPASPFHDWYTWRSTNPGWGKPWGGAGQTWWPSSGVQAARVVFPGTIQGALGASNWDPNGNSSAAVLAANGSFEFAARLPAGNYEYKAAVGGSWSENYGANDKQNGANIALKLDQATLVKFVFDPVKHSVRDSVNNPGEVSAPSAPTPPAAPPSEAGVNYYYGAFTGDMPDLNYANEQVNQAMRDAAAFWLKRGVDGFRVDAMRYILESPTGNTPDSPANIAWAASFRAFVKGVNPQAMVVGEVWTGTPVVSEYVNKGAEDLGFNFDLRDAIGNAVKQGFARPILGQEATVAGAFKPGGVDATFLTNHDMTRPEYAAPDRYQAAASVLLTLPGAPFLYYGDELGMPNGYSSDDRAKRTPLRWNDGPNGGFSTHAPWTLFSSTDPKMNVQAQQNDPASVYTHFKRLLALRGAHPALRTGDFTPLGAAPEGLLAFTRVTPQEKLLVLINLDAKPVKATLDLTGTAFAATGGVQELTRDAPLPSVSAETVNHYNAGTITPGGLEVLQWVGP